MFLSFIHFIVIAAKRKEVTVEANMSFIEPIINKVIQFMN